jgi:hypothetical protein
MKLMAPFPLQHSDIATAGAKIPPKVFEARRIHYDRAACPAAGEVMTKLTLILSALYLALVGLGLMFFPMQFGRDAVPADAAPELLALLRLLGGPFLGIATLNWLSRNDEPSALHVVLLANIVGFGAVAANDIWGVASGEARDIAKLFLVVHLLFTLAFVAAAARAGKF